MGEDTGQKELAQTSHLWFGPFAFEISTSRCAATNFSLMTGGLAHRAEPRKGSSARLGQKDTLSEIPERKITKSLAVSSGSLQNEPGAERITAIKVGLTLAVGYKFGGSHKVGCACPICEERGGRHKPDCMCSSCGEWGGRHQAGCKCPLCGLTGGTHQPNCRCPRCGQCG
jgi:hypothetical protein